MWAIYIREHYILLGKHLYENEFDKFHFHCLIVSLLNHKNRKCWLDYLSFNLQSEEFILIILQRKIQLSAFWLCLLVWPMWSKLNNFHTQTTNTLRGIIVIEVYVSVIYAKPLSHALDCYVWKKSMTNSTRVSITILFSVECLCVWRLFSQDSQCVHDGS